MRLISLLFCIIFSFPAQANIGDMPDEQQLAMQYIKAYTEHDFKTLRQFYTRESIFFDKTAGVE